MQGRKRMVLDEKQIERIKAAFVAGVSNAEVKQRFGVSAFILRANGLSRCQQLKARIHGKRI
jgi:hypothetical protein